MGGCIHLACIPQSLSRNQERSVAGLRVGGKYTSLFVAERNARVALCALSRFGDVCLVASRTHAVSSFDNNISPMVKRQRV